MSMARLQPALLTLLVGLSTSPQAGVAGIADSWAGTYWGETESALLAHFGARATVAPSAVDFGDSYAKIVLHDVTVGGFRLVAFFQMDKATGGLKRIQLERPRHGVTLTAFRAVLGALEAAFGMPDAACDVGPGRENGYQAAAERIWQRDGAVIRAIFRDTTIAAFESCLADGATVPCGLTGQLLVRISPPGADIAGCTALPAARAR